MSRELVKLDVRFISLVKRPANGESVVLKGGQPCACFEIVKTDDELKRVYGIVYAPNVVDSQGDWAKADAIRKAADNFMVKGRTQNVDREHDYEHAPAFVAESWIVRKGDPLFPERAGAWAVGIQVMDDGLWVAAKKGEVAGLSLAGSGRGVAGREPEQKNEEAPSWFVKFFKGLTGHKQEDDVDPKELKKMVGEAVKDHLPGVVAEALKGVFPEGGSPEGGKEGKPDKEADGSTEKGHEPGAEEKMKSAVDDAVKVAMEPLKAELTKMLADGIAKGKEVSASAQEKNNDYREMV